MFFIVLKTIGIILLIIVAVVLVLLALVLFVPVRYKVFIAKNSETEGELKCRIDVTWLLHLLHVIILPVEDDKIALRILGIRIKLSGLKKKQKPKKCGKDIINKNKEPVESLENGECARGGPQETPRTNFKGDENKQTVWEKLKKRLATFFGKIRAKINKIRGAILKWGRFLLDEDNKEAIKVILGEVKGLIRAVLPKKIDGYITFGTGDEYNTGRILALAAMFYPLYGDKVKITPDFNDKVFDGELKIKGGIRIITLLVIIIKLAVNKKVRNVISFVMNKDRRE